MRNAKARITTNTANGKVSARLALSRHSPVPSSTHWLCLNPPRRCYPSLFRDPNLAPSPSLGTRGRGLLPPAHYPVDELQCLPCLRGEVACGTRRRESPRIPRMGRCQPVWPFRVTRRCHPQRTGCASTPLDPVASRAFAIQTPNPDRILHAPKPLKARITTNAANGKVPARLALSSHSPLPSSTD